MSNSFEEYRQRQEMEHARQRDRNSDYLKKPDDFVEDPEESSWNSGKQLKAVTNKPPQKFNSVSPQSPLREEMFEVRTQRELEKGHALHQKDLLGNINNFFLSILLN
jgi:hypothetical protein